jgi:hypothetical protein
MRSIRPRRSGVAPAARPARRHLYTGLLAVALCALLPATASAVSYVAMGDSYTSGPGVPPASATAPPQCGQSEANYPHLVAKALGLTLTDVSCGGAKTEDFTVEQFPGVTPPQFNALMPTTEVVSLGMGGNDNNVFGTTLTVCTEADAANPAQKGAPCKEKLEGFVTESFEKEKAPQEQALREIKEKSPMAKVFVVGYPEVMPAKGFCPTAIPWTAGDLKWFHSKVSMRGNKLLKEGAKANGAIFVEALKPSKGHNLCEPVGTRWIEPLIKPLLGVPVHPNAAGEENTAFDVERVMLNNGVR